MTNTRMERILFRIHTIAGSHATPFDVRLARIEAVVKKGMSDLATDRLINDEGPPHRAEPERMADGDCVLA
jgi:hypothetical protein